MLCGVCVSRGYIARVARAAAAQHIANITAKRRRQHFLTPTSTSPVDLACNATRLCSQRLSLFVVVVFCIFSSFLSFSTVFLFAGAHSVRLSRTTFAYTYIYIYLVLGVLFQFFFCLLLLFLCDRATTVSSYASIFFFYLDNTHTIKQ